MEAESATSVFNVEDVLRRAEEEGARAGHAAAAGNPIAPTLEALPGRMWIKERFDEYVSAKDLQLKARRRKLVEDLEVVGQDLRESDSVLERLAAEVTSLEPQIEQE